jgi:uncharacterized protein with GYD domain
MPRYLALFKYSEAGAKGLMKEKAAAREAAGRKAYESIGGKSEALYWIPNAEYHGAEIIELPNAATAAAISVLAYSTGAFSEYRTMEWLTTSELRWGSSEADGISTTRRLSRYTGPRDVAKACKQVGR